MSAPNTSSSSALVSFAQDVNYTKTEGFKRFKAAYNGKNTCVACNDPRGLYPCAKDVYQVAKGPGCSQCSFNSLGLQDFIETGAVATCHCLKRLSLTPYYVAQMWRCTQKWDKRDDQGLELEVIDTCHQLVGVVGTGLYHSMANVQMTVSAVLALKGVTITDTFL